MTARPLIAALELGGTKCVAMLSTGPDDIRAEARIASGDPDQTLDALDEVVRSWRDRHGFDAIGLSSFGPIDLDPASATHGRLVNTPKPNWSGVDLLGRARKWGVPVGFDTDVNASAWAEHRWGGAQGLTSFIYITMGTGLGVGSIVDGRTVKGLWHSEAGHMLVPRLPGATWPGHCPYHGDCVEGLVCGPAIEARAGFPGDQLTRQDPVWDEVVHAMAGLLHNLVFALMPQRILIGGGVGLGQAHLWPRVRARLADNLAGYLTSPRVAGSLEDFIAAPALGHRAGPLGGVALGLRVLEGAN
ncbi:ROK family protein [Brevundimonas sp.]|uniref:ROK family protein n=1 Tax=Brevundimonas sp. TaxID=1871086 RepID=UPI0035AECAFF